MTKAEAGTLGGQKMVFYKTQRINLYLENPKKCKKCNQNIEYDKRCQIFCSKSCSASFNNVGLRRHGKGKKECINCKKEHNNPKFCSNKCQQIHYHIILLEKFTKGLIVYSPAQYKILIEKNGNFCSICNNNGEWFGKPLKLQVDHVDGNANNNFPNNLRLICPNCHTQTPTWGMRNIGKGRKSIIGPGI